MNRSVERHRLRVTGARPGEVVVSPFDHPARGPVRCSAAPLVVGELRHRGWRVREGTVTVGPRDTSGDSVLFAVTYVDRSGETVGFGVAAHLHDGAALAAAADAADRWRSVLRTRRLLVATIDPSCDGVRRARQLVARQERASQPRYVLGHSPDLDTPDTVTVRNLDEVPHAATVVFPPFGVTAAIRTEARARGLHVIDTTCPIVGTAHETVRRFAADGHSVVLIAGTGRDATSALVGQAPAAVATVESVADVADLQLDPDRVSYVVGGGVHVGHAVRLAAALRARYPRVRAQHPDGLCYATTDRAETVRSVWNSSDTVLVQGHAPIADEMGTARVHRISHAGDIRPEWLASSATVGLVSSSSDPDPGREVIEALSGLGPLSVARRRVTTDIVKHG